MKYLALFVFSSITIQLAFSQDTKIDWIAGRSNNLISTSKLIPCSDQVFGVLDLSGRKKAPSLTLFDRRIMDEPKQVSLDENASKWDRLNIGAVGIGGDIYTYKANLESEITSLIELTSSSGADKLLVNEINNLDKEVVETRSAISSDMNFSVVHSTTLPQPSSKEKMMYVPYIGMILNGSPKQRKLTFYNRIHVITVFNKNGEIAWTKSFEIGAIGDLFLTQEVRIDNNGIVYLLGESGDFRYSPHSAVDRTPFVNGPDKIWTCYMISNSNSEPVKKSHAVELEGFKSVEEVSLVYQFIGDDLYRVSNIQVETTGNKEKIFFGFHVVNLSEKALQGVVIPVEITDLRNTLSSSQAKAVDKGESVTIGTPEIRHITINEAGEIGLFLEEYSARYSDNGSTHYFRNLTSLFADVTGKVVSSNIEEQYQKITKESWIDRGGVGILDIGDQLVCIQNDNNAKHSWSGQSIDGILIRYINKNTGRVLSSEFLPPGKNNILPRLSYNLGNGQILLVGSATSLIGESGDGKSTVGFMTLK